MFQMTNFLFPKEYAVYLFHLPYTNKEGERVTETELHNIVAWGKTADIIEKYVGKGKEVILKGKLTTRSYETKEGEKRYTTEVVCDEIVMLGNK